MMKDKIRNRIAELVTHICFEYNNRTCGVDPIYSKKNGQRFDMWYGEDIYTARSIDEVMTVKFFDGKSLNDIADEIKEIWE